MNYETTTAVDAKRVQDMIIGALEGGSTYWAEDANLLHPKREDLPADGVVWWGNSKRNVFAEPDFRVAITFHNGEEHETALLDADKIKSGLQVMAAKYPRHFADMVNENDDADTADVFLQCCLFGEVIYG